LWARLISRWIWILCSYNEFLLSFLARVFEIYISLLVCIVCVNLKFKMNKLEFSSPSVWQKQKENLPIIVLVLEVVDNIRYTSKYLINTCMMIRMLVNVDEVMNR